MWTQRTIHGSRNHSRLPVLRQGCLRKGDQAALSITSPMQITRAVLA